MARAVRLFCESGGPNNQGEEVLHLPTIVDTAESSPAAAKEAANVIRKFLAKENFMRAYVQYNAIMLVRILADNPGKTFTRNLEGKFVVTTKELLRDGRDMSVQQILRETLDTFQLQKSQDETLAPLITMWQNEKAKMAKKGLPFSGTPAVPRPLNAPPYNPVQQNHNYFGRSHGRSHGLPPPHELASRIEEAKTSGKLLLQVVQSTPTNEVLNNELIKEFSDRCQSASRSIQGYINSDNPPPDEDTLLTLIETNDQLSVAMSKYQRAVLQARKVATPSPIPPAIPSRGPPPLAPQTQGTFSAPFPPVDVPPPGPPPSHANNNDIPPSGPPPRLGMPLQRREKPDNPFDDTHQNSYLPTTNGTSAVPPPKPLQTSTPGNVYNAYDPHYRSTPSYVNRQADSVGEVTMHGAGMGDAEPESPVESRQPVQYRF
ncbi:hypothetical protein MMC19_003812 [Ptychographa xylographoides]|nr:hypothetical protein [Ptychographa xylographoides]